MRAIFLDFQLIMFSKRLVFFSIKYFRLKKKIGSLEYEKNLEIGAESDAGP